MLMERQLNGRASEATSIGVLFPFFTMARSIMMRADLRMLRKARVFSCERTKTTLPRVGTLTIANNKTKGPVSCRGRVMATTQVSPESLP